MDKHRVLIGSPIHQKHPILAEFLESLQELAQDTINIDFLFIDDNESVESKKLLSDFKNGSNNVTILQSDNIDRYDCNDTTHHWNEKLIWKVAHFKNIIIQTAIEHNYDYLFLIDSDLVLHPKTIEHLIATEKDVVSTIFWTRWMPNTPRLPQVWLDDQYTLYERKRHERLTQQEIDERSRQFLLMLNEPGTYEVGGLGACTLISRRALLLGVNFNEIKNVTFHGEDRHFCIRAIVLGLSLYVDTHLPAYHIYRVEDIQGIARFKKLHSERERKLVEFLILETLRLGMESLGAYDYRRGYLIDGKKYFSGAMNEALRTVEQQDYEKNVRDRLTAKAVVADCVIRSIDFGAKVAIVSYTLSQNGMRGGWSFQEEFLCEAVLIETGDRRWVIDGFQVLEERKVKMISGRRFAKDQNNKLTLSMVVRNEASRYLRKVLEEHKQYIDNAVIIDDGSEDNSVDVCREVLGEIPIVVIRNSRSKFSNEIELRKQQWEETLKTKPDWILNLDADEMFEPRFRADVKALINQEEIDLYCFRLYDMWDEHHYREDEFWNAHFFFKPFLFRYQKEFNYVWKETAQHCGRFPQNLGELPTALSNIKLKHFGWADPKDRIAKHLRYRMLDGDAKHGVKEQYDSILEESPRLIQWIE